MSTNDALPPTSVLPKSAVASMNPPCDLADLPTSSLAKPADFAPAGAVELTYAMLIAWCSQPDARETFDIESATGRSSFRRWYQQERYGRAIRKWIRRRAAALVRQISNRLLNPTPGVNLVGYAQGIFGVGEHLRLSAAAFEAAGVPGAIVNYPLGIGSRRQAVPRRLRKVRSARHRCNLFHINADQMVRAYMHYGPSFFAGHYNIGFWAWELPLWPDDWIPVIGMVDEIWAPSMFVRQALAGLTSKPVEWMPECVEIPRIQPLRRSEFGLGDDEFVFLFAFDGYSYIERKNPLAAVRAFRAAFPMENRARLIIKAMNAKLGGTAWESLKAEAAADHRVTIIDAVWPRDRLFSLMNCSDAYVSLHRSEGFGRTPAEAMLLGKPVIVTNYSGTTDFCREDNALLVDYELVPVARQSYVRTVGQVWADPSIECAARHMRSLFDDRLLGAKIGAKGQQTISEQFGPSAVGARYRNRLLTLGMI